MSKTEDSPLLDLSVQLGGSNVTLVAWPELSVRGLAQRLLSASGLFIDPDAVELHLDRYLLSPSISLGTVVSRWHRAEPTSVVRLKAVVPSFSTGKARLKLDARGPPLHSVRQVAGRAVAALAMTAGPTRLLSAVSAAADVCLLPYTFTNWTDAWDHSLMKVSVLLFRALLSDKPGSAGAVLQACSDLLDLPPAFAPRGQLYQGLCTLQLHIFLLQVANELKAAGFGSAAGAVGSAPVGPAAAAAAVTAGTAATAAAPACPQTSSCCTTSRAAATAAAGGGGGGGRGARRAAGPGRGAPGPSRSSRCGSGGVISSRAAAEARQRDAAMEALQQLLGKAAARVGVVLEHLSCYGSELSDILDEYGPPAADPVGGPNGGVGGASSGGGGTAVTAVTAGGSRGHLEVAPPTARDLRLQVAELLEPYAAMQLVDAFGRLMVAGYPACAPPPLLPLGTLPSGWGCHRSLFHVILDLAVRAGVRLAPAVGHDGHGDGEATTQGGLLGETHGSVAAPSGGPVLDLPLVATMLDALLQLHVQAHAGCKSRGASGQSGGGGAGADGGDVSDDGSDGDGGPRCCPRTPAVCQLPPCLDWLQDVISVLGAVCDVYALAGGSETEPEAGVLAEREAARGVEPLPPSGAAAAAGGGLLVAPATAMTTQVTVAASDTLPINFGASAAAFAAAAGATAAAMVAAAGSMRLGDAGLAAAVAAAAADSASAPGPSVTASEAQARSSVSGAATTPSINTSPGPAAPRTPAAGGGGGEAGGSGGSGGSSASDRESGDWVRSCPLHVGASAPSEHTPPKAQSSAGGGAAADGEEDEDGPPAPATPLQVGAALGTPGTPLASAAAATAAAAPKGATAAAAPGPAPAASGSPPPALLSARSMVLDTLLRAFQCPCLVEQALAGGARTGELCERAVWRHPRLAACAPAAAYQKQVLDELLTPLSYVYEEDDYDAPMVVVDRADLLGSSMASLMDQDNLHHEGMCVTFEDEMAYGDGVLREWLTEISAAVFDPNAGLFRLCEGDARALHLSPAGSQQDDQLELLNFAGRIIGLAMRARVPLGFHLSSALFKLLQHPGGAGRARLGLTDLAQLEPRLAATCGQIAAAGDVEALGLTFVASCGQLGLAHEVPLLPGGRGEDEAVNAANRRDYLDRLVRFYCTWGCSSEHGGLMMGSSSCGKPAPGARAGGKAATGDGGAADGGEGGTGGAGFNWDECELDAVESLAQGLADSLFECEYEERVEVLAARLRPISAAAFNSRLGGEVGGIDVASWRSHTSAPAFKSDKERAVLELFWAVVSELSPDEQRRLLQFWTGISHLPAGGFKHLSQQLQIVPVRTGEDGGSGGEVADAAVMHVDEVSDFVEQLISSFGGEGDGDDGIGGSGGGSGGSGGGIGGIGGGIGGIGGGIGGSGGGIGGSGGGIGGGGGGSGGDTGGSGETSIVEVSGAAGGLAGASVGSGGVGSSAASSSEAAADERARSSGGTSSTSSTSESSSSSSNGRGGGSGSSSDSSASGSSSGGRGDGGDGAASAAAGSDRATAAGGGGGGGGPRDAGGGGTATGTEQAAAGAGRAAAGPVLLAAHTCFFQLRLPLLGDKPRMREAVVESLANLGAFWNE